MVANGSKGELETAAHVAPTSNFKEQIGRHTDAHLTFSMTKKIKFNLAWNFRGLESMVIEHIFTHIHRTYTHTQHMHTHTVYIHTRIYNIYIHTAYTY